MIYIDGIQLGRTPMSFPVPTGCYTLVLLAHGHQRMGLVVQVMHVAHQRGQAEVYLRVKISSHRHGSFTGNVTALIQSGHLP